MSLRVGDLVEGVATRVRPFGVFFDLAGGESALLLVPDCRLGRGQSTQSHFAVGDRHELEVIGVADTGHLEVRFPNDVPHDRRLREPK